MDPSRTRSTAAPGTRMEPGALIRRLIQRIARSAPAAEGAQGDQPPPDLPPAGRRSGEGAESLAPFLDQARNTRPGPLE